MNPKVLILGYGNPLRGDDGFGCEAARRLAAFIRNPGIDIREMHQLTPELAEPIGHAGHVIFIDASREDPPGKVQRRPVGAASPGTFTHHLTPATLLACALELYGRAPDAVLFTAGGMSFEYGMILSEPMEAAVNEVCRQVLALLNKL